MDVAVGDGLGAGSVYLAAPVDPQFIRTPFAGLDGVWGTADDDYGDLRLRTGSTAINAGSNASIPAGITTDITGGRRIVGGTVDMGAYELNQSPTDISLSQAAVAETRPIGTVVGTFSTTDPDAGDTFAYSLVSGTGGTGNASFMISRNQLKTAAVFNYQAKSSYSIRVRTSDAGGLFCDRIFTVRVTDATAPTITSVKINDENTQRSMVDKVAVIFSEAVTLAGGALSVVKSTGAVMPNVTVTAGNPSGDQKSWELTFSGSATVGGSLPDGLYKVVVLAAGVSDLAGNHLAGNYAQAFHRRFGDVDGDLNVDEGDLAVFKVVLNRPAKYVWWLDQTGDRRIDNADYLSLRARLLKPLLM